VILLYFICFQIVDCIMFNLVTFNLAFAQLHLMNYHTHSHIIYNILYLLHLYSDTEFLYLIALVIIYKYNYRFLATAKC